jgi:hypothetical protein
MEGINLEYFSYSVIIYGDNDLKNSMSDVLYRKGFFPEKLNILMKLTGTISIL